MSISPRATWIGSAACLLAVATACADLPNYWQLALSGNPGLQAEREGWQAERAAAESPLGFADPKFSYTRLLVGLDKDDETRPNMFMLEQELPGWGKRSRRHERGLARAAMAQQGFLSQRLALMREVSRVYYEYAYLSRELEISREQSEFVQLQESVLAARYRATATQHPDLIRARIELLRIEDRIRSIRDELTAVGSEFNALLGQPTVSSFPWPIQLDSPRPELPDLPQLRASIEQRSLALRTIDAEIAYYGTSRDAALTDRRPDFMIGIQTPMIEPNLEHEDSDAMDAWWATLSMRLPLANGEEEAQAREAQALQRSAEHLRAQESLVLQAKLDRLWFRHENARARQALLQDQLVPLAQQGLDALGARMQTGETSFVDWVEAVHTLFDLQLELAGEMREEAVAAVEILALVDALPLPEVGAEP